MFMPLTAKLISETLANSKTGPLAPKGCHVQPEEGAQHAGVTALP